MTPQQRNEKAATLAAEMIAYYADLPDEVMTPKDKMLQLMNTFVLMLTGDSDE